MRKVVPHYGIRFFNVQNRTTPRRHSLSLTRTTWSGNNDTELSKGVHERDKHRPDEKDPRIQTEFSRSRQILRDHLARILNQARDTRGHRRVRDRKSVVE